MNKNTAKIKAGITALTHKPYEIISGTVVSIDTSAYTITVQPSDDSEPIEGVMLNAITGSADGVIVFPQTNSNVVIGSIDGPGEWTLIRASEITKATMKIGSVTYEMDSTKIMMQNSNVLLNISDTVFKMNTAGESLYQLLSDLITYLTVLTVPTSTGPSGIPTNVADFTSLLTRLSNLLSA